eukprot:TRINITY_DN23360_c0_g1_i1.p1 TRINITY_DN23360_c0_g1~~TRINITY_DN23360_c0_g1_i1.p1  ORF type:complete len:539 (+),score=107.16 TRINITY_DN23360_c0_g1_i1:266-1882(+)
MTNKVFLSVAVLLLFICNSSLTTYAQGNEENVDEDLQELEALEELDDTMSEEERTKAQEVSKAQRIVVDLNNDNAEAVLGSREYVLLMGYAPWCTRSSELMPEFASAANLMREMGGPVLFAKLDGDRYSKAASKCDIKGYPSFVFFVNGSSHPYTGGFTSDEMVIWLRKRIGLPTLKLASTTEATKFLRRNWTAAVALFEVSKGIAYEEFVMAAIEDNDVQFVELNDVEVAKIFSMDLKLPQSLCLLKKEPENFVLYEGTFKKDDILQFVEVNKYPLVTKVTEKNSARVFTRRVKHQVFLFATPEHYQEISSIYLDAAKKYKAKIMFLYIDSNNENHAKPMLTLFGLEASEPTIVAFDNSAGAKFVLEVEINPSNLEKFCSELAEGSLTPYYKSESVPVQNNDDVRVVVGKTFNEIVLHSSEDVLLEVYTTWCPNCKALSKLIQKLARHFRSVPSVTVAKIDISANEHPNLQVDNFPSLLFYPANKKDSPMKISTKASFEDLKKFIVENAGVPIKEAAFLEQGRNAQKDIEYDSKSEL